MPELSGLRRQAVNAAHRPDINVSGQVLGQRSGIVARQPLPRGVTDKTRMFGGWIVHPRQAAGGGSQPEASQMVHMQRSDEAFRKAIGRGELRESSCLITRQVSLIKTEPKVAGPVLGKRCNRFPGWQSIHFRELVKRFIGAPPSH